MRVVVLGLRGFPNVQGGVETHCRHLYPRLAALGCEVIVLGRTPYVGKKSYRYRDVTIKPLWSPRHKVFEALWHTCWGSIVARFLRPDVVHYHATGPSFFVVLGKMLGCRVVATHHGFDYERAKWGRFARAFIRQGEKNLCRAHGVIAIAAHIQQSIQKRLGCVATLIPNGVTLPDISGKKEYIHSLDLKSKRYFLFVGRFVKEKCIDDLLEAYRDSTTPWKCVVVGDADHADPYSISLKQKGGSIEGVVMTGFLSGEPLKEIFSHAGCFILPSSHERLPISLLEALSYNLPCIASDIPANQAVNYPHITLFPLHDTTALAGLMHQAAAGNFSPGEARLFVGENYNWDTIAKQTFVVYSKVRK